MHTNPHAKRAGAKAPPPPSGGSPFEEFQTVRRAPIGRLARAYVAEFTAPLGVAELDDRRRPGAMWEARASGLGRSRVVFYSRRMCHEGRLLLVAVHLVDDAPLVLYGSVYECVYDGDGMHRIDMDLDFVPTDSPAIKAWIDAL